jgi:hypothetical protein
MKTRKEKRAAGKTTLSVKQQKIAWLRHVDHAVDTEASPISPVKRRRFRVK